MRVKTLLFELFKFFIAATFVKFFATKSFALSLNMSTRLKIRHYAQHRDTDCFFACIYMLRHWRCAGNFVLSPIATEAMKQSALDGFSFPSVHDELDDQIFFTHESRRVLDAEYLMSVAYPGPYASPVLLERLLRQFGPVIVTCRDRLIDYSDRHLFSFGLHSVVVCGIDRHFIYYKDPGKNAEDQQKDVWAFCRLVHPGANRFIVNRLFKPKFNSILYMESMGGLSY